MPFGIGGHADFVQRLAGFRDRANEVDAVLEAADRVAVTADDEHLLHPRGADAREQLTEVRAVANQLGRQVRDDVVAAARARQPLSQLDRRVDPFRRRRSDRDRRARGQRFRFFLDSLERDDFELRFLDDGSQRRTLIRCESCLLFRAKRPQCHLGDSSWIVG